MRRPSSTGMWFLGMKGVYPLRQISPTLVWRLTDSLGDPATAGKMTEGRRAAVLGPARGCRRSFA